LEFAFAHCAETALQVTHTHTHTHTRTHTYMLSFSACIGSPSHPWGGRWERREISDVCMCLCVCMYVWMRERERERDSSLRESAAFVSPLLPLIPRSSSLMPNRLALPPRLFAPSLPPALYLSRFLHCPPHSPSLLFSSIQSLISLIISISLNSPDSLSLSLSLSLSAGHPQRLGRVPAAHHAPPRPPPRHGRIVAHIHCVLVK
jgi:hypothetical protein